MFLAVTIFVIIAGIVGAILILMSESKKDRDITRLASEFEITEIDA